MKKIALVVAIAALLIGFFAVGGQQWLTLEQLSSSSEQLVAMQQQSPIVSALLFAAVYILVTALSLPGATILTLAGGAVFGFWAGLLLVSFASTIGATLAFIASRYLFQESLQRKFSDRLQSINEGIEREGVFYLFTLRLVPIVPFFVINLVMGLTRLRVFTFYWVSQLGMLAGTAVYVNAGTQLSQLDNLSGIMSPAILLSFVLLGVFPLVAKKLLDFLKGRRVYQGWKKPASFDRNLIVIGAGAGGLVTSYIAATLRSSVTLIEKHKMGGDCLNYGCVPSKALISASKTAHQIKNSASMGVESQLQSIDSKKVFSRIDSIVKQIEPHDSVERYTNLGVDVRLGTATIIDPWTVEITADDGNQQRLTGKRIVLATGASPVVPNIPGISDSPYVTSDTLWQHCGDLNELPKKIVILGGGPIGCEMAQSFARLGSDVTQVERGTQLMGNDDFDVADYVRKQLVSDGVKVQLGQQAIACHQVDGRHCLEVVSSDNAKSSGRSSTNSLDKQKSAMLEFDLLICAVGRKPRLAGYGLESLGIDTDQRLDTNEFLQTKFPNIFAVGDALGQLQFTHVAAHHAWYAAVNALFGKLKKFKVDYRVIPRATFTDPEVARVGLNESEAKAQGLDFDVTRYGIDDLDRAITESSSDKPAGGFVKVITAKGSDKILGATIVGTHAAELLAEYVLAMKHGLGLNKILGTIHTYPTWSEANKYAAGEWKKANAPEAVLKLLQKYFRWRLGAKS